MTAEYERLWKDPCEAAEGIRDRFGWEQAIRYLVGEKFLNFLETLQHREALASELPHFVAAVRDLFEPHEIASFLDELVRENTAEKDDDWVFDDFDDAELEADDVIRAAEHLQRIEQARELLVPR